MQTALLVLRLLESFNPKLRCTSHMKSEDFLARHNLAWVINGYQRLWKAIIRWYHNARNDLAENITHIFLHFLKSLRAYSEQERSQSDLLRSDIELSRTWLRCMSDVMKLDDFNQMHSLQAGLSSFFWDTAKTYRDSKLVECLEHIFLPTVIDTRKSPIFESFNPVFQVF